jgi:hypothetical protein
VIEKPPDDRPSSKGALRPRLLVAVMAVVGLCVGLAYGMTRPQPYRAVSLVQLPPNGPSGTDLPGGDIQSQALIATSQIVLTAAGREVHPAESAGALRRQVWVQPVTEEVLKVQVAAPQAPVAVSLANAVSISYIRWVQTSDRELSTLRTHGARALGEPLASPFLLEAATVSSRPAKLRTALSWAAIGLIAGLAVGMLLGRGSRRRRTQASGPPRAPGGGVREPRRPLPFSPASSAQIPVA